jgi:hypothetical protein
MEAKHGCITEIGDIYAIISCSKGVGRIVDDLKTMTPRDVCDSIDIADIPIDMHWNDGACAVCDKGFNLADIQRIVLVVDIAKDRN